MIRATLRTITGRRGSFVGGSAVVFAAALLVVVVVVVVHTLRPGRNPSAGGQPILDGVAGAVGLVGIVVAILIGALAGSYDVAQGTMRYLVMTGATRGAIYAARVVALAAAVLLALAPALAFGGVAAVLLPHSAEDTVAVGELADVVWSTVVIALTYALISMGIGAVLRSNGPAIAISLVFFLGLTPLLFLVDRLHPFLGDVALPGALDRVTGGSDPSLVVAVAALLAWLAFFLGAGWARVQRDEY